MIFTQKPSSFNLKAEVAGCFMEHDGKILLLLRHENESHGNTWGLPSGKIEGDETPKDAVIREIEEETNIVVSGKDLKYLGKVYVRYPDGDFIYHIFHSILDKLRDVKLKPEEHTQFKWVTPEEALKMPFIKDLDACIKLVYGFN
ncbi:NUDIX hydrolase [Candidatus Woesearchaeota archaeon]|nr:NUDIX hydrolase [Candidatus Woesearchaeota archaeon]